MHFFLGLTKTTEKQWLAWLGWVHGCNALQTSTLLEHHTVRLYITMSSIRPPCCPLVACWLTGSSLVAGPKANHDHPFQEAYSITNMKSQKKPSKLSLGETIHLLLRRTPQVIVAQPSTRLHLSMQHPSLPSVSL